MAICRKVTKAIKGLYDSTVCRKDNIQCGIAPRQTKEVGLGRPASGQNSADDHQPVNDRESFTGILFFVGTEIVVSKAGVRNYVNNLFRVDERQVPGFINIVKFDD